MTSAVLSKCLERLPLISYQYLEATATAMAEVDHFLATSNPECQYQGHRGGKVMKRLSYEPLFVHLLKIFTRAPKSKNENADSKQKSSNSEGSREKAKRPERMSE